MPPTSIFTDVINQYLPAPYSSLLNGILFGVKLDTGTAFYEDIKRVGLLHLVVLSGMNISLMSGILASLTYRLGKATSLVINILIIIIFVAFVGAEAPIVRAAFAGVLTSVGLILGKRTIALYALFLSAVCLILVKPEWLTSISFQLTYGATFGIILFAPRSTPKSLWDYCKSDLRTSIAAQIFTVPIIFFYFKQVSFISPVANLLVSWTIAPIMIFGFLAAILGKINFVLGVIPAYISFGLTYYVVYVIESLSKLPYIFMQF